MLVESLRSALFACLTVGLGATASACSGDALGVSSTGSESAIAAKEASSLSCAVGDTPREARVRVRLGITLNVACAQPATWTDEDRTLVLLHGFPEFWRAWDAVIPTLLSAGYRVVVPDQRGYDLSDQPDDGNAPYAIEELVADVDGLVALLGPAYQSGARKVTLVAHDWGGVVAWSYASRHQEHLDGLVVMDAVHPRAAQVTYKDPAQRQAADYVTPLLNTDWLPPGLLAHQYRDSMADSLPDASELDRFSAAWASRMPGNPHASEKYMARWYAANIAIDEDDAGKFARFTDQGVVVGPITVPVHVLWGTKDIYALPLNASYLERPDFKAAWLPRLEPVEFLDGGHFINHERAAEVAASIVAFAGSLAPVAR